MTDFVYKVTEKDTGKYKLFFHMELAEDYVGSRYAITYITKLKVASEEELKIPADALVRVDGNIMSVKKAQKAVCDYRSGKSNIKAKGYKGDRILLEKRKTNSLYPYVIEYGTQGKVDTPNGVGWNERQLIVLRDLLLEEFPASPNKKVD